LEVCNGYDRRVHWELLVIDAETVAVSVGVGEEATLQDRVRTRLDSGYDVGRRKCCLFNLRKVVLWVFI
jgi:hypothetical protein